jgi:hypothetical protein
MAMRGRRFLSRLALVAGLGLWTLAPYGGCSCSNPMGSSAPAQTQKIYGGLEAGKVPANLVDDFNDGGASSSPTGHWQNVYVNGTLVQVWYNGNDPAYRVDLWGGGTYTQADSFGTQYFSELASSGSNNSGTCLQFGSPSTMIGRTFPPVSCSATVCGAVYPFVEHGMFLSPLGAAGDANVEFNAASQSVPGVDNGTMTGHGLQLTYNTHTNTLEAKLKLLYLSNYTNTAPCTNSDAYAFHYFVLPDTGGAWSTYQIPFNKFSLKPNFPRGTYTANGQPIGTNLIWGSSANAGTLADPAARVDGNGDPIGTLRISAIEFDATETGGTGTCSTTVNNFTQLPYDFDIDNVEFY